MLRRGRAASQAICCDAGLISGDGAALVAGEEERRLRRCCREALFLLEADSLRGRVCFRRVLPAVALAFVGSALMLSPSSAAPPYPFRNPGVSVNARVDDLLGRLTVDEKIPMLPPYAPAIPRLGIPIFKTGTEALHGVAKADDKQEAQRCHLAHDPEAQLKEPYMARTRSGIGSSVVLGSPSVWVCPTNGRVVEGDHTGPLPNSGQAVTLAPLFARRSPKASGSEITGDRREAQ